MHCFFIANSRAVVDHVDREGTAPDPLVWSAGALPKRRRFVHSVLNHAMLPCPAVIWTYGSVFLPLCLPLRMKVPGLTLLVF